MNNNVYFHYINMSINLLYQTFGNNNFYFQQPKIVTFKNAYGGNGFKLCDGKSFGEDGQNHIGIARELVQQESLFGIKAVYLLRNVQSAERLVKQ